MAAKEWFCISSPDLGTVVTDDAKDAKEVYEDELMRLPDNRVNFTTLVEREEYDRLREQLQNLYTMYEERGMAMKETGDMVRSAVYKRIDEAYTMVERMEDALVEIAAMDPKINKDKVGDGGLVPAMKEVAVNTLNRLYAWRKDK
jgi:hypothetical protein